MLFKRTPPPRSTFLKVQKNAEVRWAMSRTPKEISRPFAQTDLAKYQGGTRLIGRSTDAKVRERQERLKLSAVLRIGGGQRRGFRFSAETAMPDAKVLLVGWDGADWKVANPLIDSGRMPNLARLVEQGVAGNLASLQPELSPLLWTSIATGKRPFKHGVLGFTEPVPGGGVRPVTNLSRKTRALWNIMTVMGLRSHVVGWWPSHPAEPILGCMVTDHYHRAVAAKGEPWPMPPGNVHPQRISKNLAELRVHPQDLDPGLIQLFLPRLADIDQEKDRRVTQMAKTISEATTIANAARALLHFESWRLACVYFDAIDHFSHGFMSYHPPRPEWIDERDFELYKEVVTSGYIYHDILLGQLLAECDDLTTVVLVSDHGFHSDHLRPPNVPPDEPAGPAEQHRSHGVFVACGPGLKRDERVYGAGLLDIAPTVLTCLGLPVGEDMDGKALLDIFESPPPVEYLPSWDEVEGDAGLHPRDAAVDPLDAVESLRRLAELGYIEPPPENAQKAADEALREIRWNLARSYVDASLHIEAVPILQELVQHWPAEFRFQVLLVNCLIALDRADEASRLLEQLIAARSVDVEKAREELKSFLESHKEQLEKLREGDPEAMSERDRHLWRKLRARSGWNQESVSYLFGVTTAARKDYLKAVEHFQKALKLGANNIRILLKLGDAYLGLERLQEAGQAFDRVLELDPESADGWLGLARVRVKSRLRADNACAAEATRRSIGLRYFNPLGHYLLGIASHRTGNLVQAVRSLQTAVDQNPNFPEALDRLAFIYKHRLGAVKEAEDFRRQAKEARRRIQALRNARGIPRFESENLAGPPMPENEKARFEYDPATTVVIVCGLPRSGTSMVMRMLQCGGVPVVSDGVRKADVDNPRGYFELEKTRRLARDSAWVLDAPGKAVKVIATLLPALPRGVRYKILFIWREMEEMLRSQKAMIERAKSAADQDPEALARVFAAHLRRAVVWAKANENADFLFLSYTGVLERPEQAAQQINSFLGGGLAVEQMAAAVEPALRRQF